MSETATPRSSTRARAIFAMLALVFASGVIGATIDRAVARNTRLDALHDTAFHPLSSLVRSPTASDRQQYRAQLSRALDLSPSQDSAVDKITSERAGEFSALREEIRPRVEHLVADVRADIEKVLTDTQREAFRALQKRGRDQLVSNGQAP
ncbi:MAG: hypothetical protein ABJF01_25325 [bacterium]